MKPETSSANASADGEMSIKELLLNIGDWVRYLLHKWVFIVIGGLLGAGIGIACSLLNKPKYVAELTFVMEDSKANPFSAYAGIASQFGVDLGGTAASGVFSGDNIMEFLRSRLMVEKALLSSISINGRQITLADYYLEFNGQLEAWSKIPDLKNLRFLANVKRQDLARQQDSVLNTIYQKLVHQNLSITKPDKKLGFISVACTTRDEVFSKVFVERLVTEAIDFYVQTKTKRYKTSLDKLQEKADSIELLLNRKTYSMAASQDMNLNPARNLAGVSTELVARDKLVLQTMYGEIVKNLELSRMSMAQETPIIQTVDMPIFPLKKERLGKAKGLLIGGTIGGFLVALYLVISLLYKKIMA